MLWLKILIQEMALLRRAGITKLFIRLMNFDNRCKGIMRIEKESMQNVYNLFIPQTYETRWCA